MNERFLRTEMIVGAPALDKLRRSHVAVFGLGGVGSYAAECLARSGVGTLTLVDQDTVSVSNINRQLCALTSTVGQYKAEVVAARVRDINPDAVVYPICATYDAAHREEFFTRRFDYILDCIDLVSCKLDLIQPAGHPHPDGAGHRQQAGAGAAADRGYLPDQRLPAGPGHAEGAAEPGHPPPDGGLFPGTACAYPAAGGSPAGTAERSRQ